MNSLFSKQIKSNLDNNFILKIFLNNNEIEIIIVKKGELIYEEYILKIGLNEIHEMNEYFKSFKTLNDILDELIKRIDSSVRLIEEKENLLLNITIPKSKNYGIFFTLIKNENNSIDIFDIIEKFNLKVQQLENEIKNLKEENNKIKEKFNKISIENSNLKLEKKEINDLYEKLKNHFNEIKMNLVLKKNNFHWINDEVEITNSSEFRTDFPADIVLNKHPMKPYCLSKGTKNHFIEFSFRRIYYLKSIRISITELECSLKSFKIDIFDLDGKKEEIDNLFVLEKYSDKKKFQEFAIEKICKKILINFIDNWGSGGGDYILISRIEFNVSD